MRTLELIRLQETEQGTLGILKLDKAVFCCTLEPADRVNAKNVSSIPAQQYLCTQYNSSRHGNTFIVENVPGRSSILFHAGNTAEHTEGCILLGSEFGKLRGNLAVLNSGATFSQFMGELDAESTVHLTIKEAY